LTLIYFSLKYGVEIILTEDVDNSDLHKPDVSIYGESVTCRRNKLKSDYAIPLREGDDYLYFYDTLPGENGYAFLTLQRPLEKGFASWSST